MVGMERNRGAYSDAEGLLEADILNPITAANERSNRWSVSTESCKSSIQQYIYSVSYRFFLRSGSGLDFGSASKFDFGPEPFLYVEVSSSLLVSNSDSVVRSKVLFPPAMISSNLVNAVTVLDPTSTLIDGFLVYFLNIRMNSDGLESSTSKGSKSLKVPRSRILR
jgi:hypothetical protein